MSKKKPEISFKIDVATLSGRILTYYVVWWALKGGCLEFGYRDEPFIVRGVVLEPGSSWKVEEFQ